MIYILKYRGKPVTVSTMLSLTKKYTCNYYTDDQEIYICAPKKKLVIDEFLHYVGFTWREWMKDGWSVEVVR